ncbi:MAG TPA: DUF547 domain-containing protein [Xanthomonadales bacterium]|nr:DUF547 domain-containing protein [Xanthomonadales bacterium]
MTRASVHGWAATAHADGASMPAPSLTRSLTLALLLALLPMSLPAAGFDHHHRTWDALLRRHVHDSADRTSSRLDYAGVATERDRLHQYLDALQAVTPEDYRSFDRDQRLAFLINAYNAFTVESILRHYPRIDSIRAIGGLFGNPWRIRFFRLLGVPRHLDDIEHGLIRQPGVFDEPLIHFAVNCAAADCPPLRNEAYVAGRLDQQLRDQTLRFLGHRAINRLDAEAQRVWVTPLLDWYAGDFGGERGVRAWLAEHGEWLGLDPEQQRQLAAGTLTVAFTDYDWTLNDIHSAEERAVLIDYLDRTTQ